MQVPTSLTNVWRKVCPLPESMAGLLDNRSFGGVQVSRTFYAKGQTGQQLLLRVHTLPYLAK